MTKEQLFYNILQDLFVGAKLEGDSGYVNLMNIKTSYFNLIKKKIETEIKRKFGNDKPEDLYDKLYTFFDSYLSDGGSIFFSSTPNYRNIYAKVYSDREDVSLFWKTSKLYYVKSEANYRTIKNLQLDSDPEVTFDFHFDASLLKHKKANEKKEIQFYFIGTQIRANKQVLKFKVLYKNDNKYDQLKEMLNIKEKNKIIKYILKNWGVINKHINFKNSGLDLKLLNEKGGRNFVKTELIIQINQDLLGGVTLEPSILDLNAIEKYLRLKNIYLNLDIIEKAFRVYKKQTVIDYFIHKNAKDFLREQFDLYMYQHLTGAMDTIFMQQDLERIKKIKEIAYLSIDYISNFEDELKKIWEKPKFVRNSNYVISLLTLKELVNIHAYEKIKKDVYDNLRNNLDFYEDILFTVKDIFKQPLRKIYVGNVYIKDEIIKINYIKVFDEKKDQIKYLQQNLSEKAFEEDVFDRNNKISGYFATYSGGNLPREMPLEKIYIDTIFFNEDFKKRLLETLSENNNIDDILNGYLIKSDNYQALNSLNKFNDQIKLIYIDPPFNTENSSYAYIDKFKDSTWLSMMQDRIILALDNFLSNDGSFYIHLDDNCNYLIRLMLDQLVGKEPTREIMWNTGEALSGFKTQALNWIRQHDTIFYYSKDKPLFNKLWVKNDTKKINSLGWLDIYKDENSKLFVYKYQNGQKRLSKHFIPNVEVKAVGDMWNDIFSLMYTQNMTRENWGEDKTQKPENLLRRIIQSSTNEYDFVFDYFVGSGTTVSAAHKLNRKWIGIEMGDFIKSIVLKRIKTVIFGDIRPKLSEDLNWEGGGFIKYYELEQYEDTLKNAAYNPTEKELENIDFSLSEKQASIALDIDLEKENAKFVFNKLYPDVDIAETISNLFGKKINKFIKNKIILEDDYELNLNDLSFNKYESLKKLIYW
jgi:adenine-specific DNA-methyltransferase